MAAYAAFGAWIKACYGAPVARVSPPPGATSVTLPLGAAPVAVDRVMMQEDLAQSQRVAGYRVEFLAANGSWAPFSAGGPIGSKRIDLLGEAGPVATTALRLTVLDSFAPPQLTNFAAFAPDGCETPKTRVKFGLGGLCLVSNATFPCPGGTGNSCPVFLGNCNDPSAVWDDSQGVLENVHFATPGLTAQINIDCNSETPHTVAKLLQAGGNPIAFADGQLAWQGTDLCLNAGQGPLIPPCNSGEGHAAQQIQVDLCSSASTQGWTRTVAPPLLEAAAEVAPQSSPRGWNK